MTTRTIEIEDTLDDNVQCAIDEVSELLENAFKEDPEEESPPDLSDLNYSGGVSEIVDSSVPMYTHEIETTWYLHSNRLEQAYEDSGIGDNPRENSGMVAIYCYIEQQVYGWYDEHADDLWEDWREKYLEDNEE